MRPISVNEIPLKQPLPFSVYDREGKLLLEAGCMVSSDHMRESLAERGFAKEERPKQRVGHSQSDRDAHFLTGGPGQSVVRGKSISIDVLELRDQLRTLLARLLRPDGEGQAGQLLALRDKLIELAERDDEAVVAAIQLSAIEDAAAARPMHAGFLAFMIGKAMKLSADELLALTGAGLSYDCALAPLAATLNHQTSAPTVEQRRLIMEHPLRSMEALRRAGIDDPAWLDAVLHHHERLDGSGYPSAKVGDAISRDARILGLVDNYCALIRPRAYRAAVDVTEALRALFVERTSKIDPDLAALFITDIGLHPPGTIVRLESNEIAIVFRRGTEAGTPRVRVLLDAIGKNDVSKPERNTARPGHRIVESLQADRYVGVLSGIERIWD